MSPPQIAQWSNFFDNDNIQNAIQDGTFEIPTSIPMEAQQLIKQMRRPTCIKCYIPSTTTLQDFRQFIKKTKEKTSSSPSGRHYGHYATLLKADPEYLRVIHGILELALAHNIILDRWKTTHTTLLDKNPGNPWIHRLRAIHIVEGDLQFIAKYFYSYKMMKLAEAKKLISDEQYEGRAQRMAQSAVINKLLYYNISHQTHTSAAFMDDDARACYDRIVTKHSSLESRKWGLSSQIANFTTKFINTQHFHIRTSHGISSGEYHYDKLNPIQGSGQGLSWAGPRWTATGDSITKIMATECAGMYFEDPTGLHTVHKNGDHFVDDRATGSTANCTFNGNTPLQQIRHDEQKHAFLLYSAGHQLALDKCSFYYYNFKRVGTKHIHTSISECPGELQLQEKYNGDMITIKRLEPSDPHKNLGCHISVTMNQTKQFSELRDKIIEWVHRIHSAPLSTQAKIDAYHSFLESSLLYVLATTSFTYQECQELNKYLSPVLLNINKIQRNGDRAIIYAGVEHGGLNIHSIFHLQGMQKIKFLLMHLRKMDTTGTLMKISMNYTQIECGIPKPFYENNFYRLQYLTTPTWITNIWQYTSECHVSLKELDPWVYSPPREYDFFLMDAVHQSNIPQQQKEIFNQVRLHMRLLTASDIVLSSSTSKIHPDIYKGINHRGSNLKWPTILPYPKHWINIFTSIINSIIKPRLSSTPLGKWKDSGHQIWKYYTHDGITIHQR